MWAEESGGLPLTGSVVFVASLNANAVFVPLASVADNFLGPDGRMDAAGSELLGWGDYVPAASLSFSFVAGFPQPLNVTCAFSRTQSLEKREIEPPGEDFINARNMYLVFDAILTLRVTIALSQLLIDLACYGLHVTGAVSHH